MAFAMNKEYNLSQTGTPTRTVTEVQGQVHGQVKWRHMKSGSNNLRISGMQVPHPFEVLSVRVNTFLPSAAQVSEGSGKLFRGNGSQNLSDLGLQFIQVSEPCASENLFETRKQPVIRRCEVR